MIYFWIALGVVVAAVWIFVGLGIIWIYEDDLPRNPDITQGMVYRWAAGWPFIFAFYAAVGLWYVITYRSMDYRPEPTKSQPLSPRN